MGAGRQTGWGGASPHLQWLKQCASKAGVLGSISGSGRFPAVGNGNLLQYSCLENPMDRGAWWATVQRKGLKEVDRIERQISHCTLPYIAENQNTTFYKHFDELERSS